MLTFNEAHGSRRLRIEIGSMADSYLCPFRRGVSRNTDNGSMADWTSMLWFND